VDQFLEAQAKSLGIDYVSLRRILCNEDGCLARIGPNGSELTVYDSGHMTYPGSIFMAEQVLKVMPGFDR
jgi:hypothetical protein